MPFPLVPDKPCGAHARSTGKPCKLFPMANGRCKFHGGKTPIKTGLYTNKAIAERKRAAALMKASKELVMEIT